MLLALLDLSSNSTIEEKANRIIKRSFYDGLAGSDKRLCVYFRPSRRGRTDLFHQQVLQVDCHVPTMQDYIAYRVLERVCELLHGWKVNNQYLWFEGQLGELPSMASFVCVGSRFTYHATI